MLQNTTTRYRKSLSSHNEVAHIWAQQSQYEGHAGNMFFKGQSIFSYGRHFEIARFIDNDVVLFTSKSYSVSTSKHKSITYRAINHKKVFTVPYFIDHSGNIKHYTDNAQAHIKKAAKSRKYAEYELKSAEDFINEMKEYAEYFNIELRDESLNLVQLLENNTLLSEETKQKIKQAEADKRKAEAEKKKEEIQEWLNGERYSLNTDKIYLRRKDDIVQTSHGADVPVLEARLLYHAVKNGLDVKGKTIGYYTVISFNGKVLTIGCHKLTIEEINRFAATQNW